MFIINKVSYRSMGTTGDPVVTGTDRITTSPARAGTGEPLHRLEPVPVRPVGHLTWGSPILGVQRRFRPSVDIPTPRTHTSNSVELNEF